MRSVLSITLINLRLLLSDKSAFFWMLGMPVAFTFVLGIAFSGGDADTVDPDEMRYALTVADLDEGPGSDELLKRIEELDEIDIIMLAGPDAGREARRLVEEGERSSALVIPPDLSLSLETARTGSLTFHRNPDRLNPHATLKALDRVVARMNVEAMAFEGAAAAHAELWGEPSGPAAERLRSHVETFVENAWGDPPLQVSAERLGRGEVSDGPAMGFQHSSPAITLMYVLLNGLMLSGMLVEERRLRTLSRLYTAPVGRARIVTANFVWRFVVALGQSAILLAIGGLVFRVDWGDSPVGIALVMASFAASVAGLSVLLGTLARTTKQAHSASLVVALSMSGLGGLWWPLEVTPPAYQAVGHLIPTGWAMDAMHNLVSRGCSLSGVMPQVWVLVAFAAAFTAAASFSFRAE